MEIFRTQNQAGHAEIPFLDASNRPSYKANPTIEAGDIKISRHVGGAWQTSNIASLPTPITDSLFMDFSLTASELNPDDTQYPVIVQCIDQTPTKEWDDQAILIWTKPVLAQSSGDTLVSISARDTNGAPIPGVTVQITNADLSLILDEHVTDANGLTVRMLPASATPYKVLLAKAMVSFTGLPYSLTVK